ncbi:hypothetical protein [Pseudonocardia xishanensis]|uniref:Uncharacterized protein n=1 Tax=Pseudonocardia xishanensis TaxID=630995 RepID=A0ABP8RR46_9PSEU
MNEVDDREPADAAAALRIIQAQQADTAARIGPRVGWFFLIWGAVWLVNGLLYFLAPGPVATWGAVAAVVAGVASSATLGARSGRGIAGGSQRQGLLYGLTWPAVMLGLGVLVGGMAGPLGLTGAQLGVLIPALFAFVAGALYAVSGAVWTYVANFVTGLWIMAVGIASVFVGLPGNALVLGVGVGGALLAVGVWELRR